MCNRLPGGRNQPPDRFKPGGLALLRAREALAGPPKRRLVQVIVEDPERLRIET